MRIVGGRWRGHGLSAPPGRGTRPTMDRTREAIFNLVGARLDLAAANGGTGATVLDVFAGSGALGLEALSRGAARATFVERHGPTLAVARRNARALGAEGAAFVRADALAFLSRPGEPADLVLADPPYDLDRLSDLPELLRARLAPDGLAVLEHDARHTFDDAPGWELSRAYGKTVVSLFRVR